jgi:hypothetical protein
MKSTKITTLNTSATTLNQLLVKAQDYNELKDDFDTLRPSDTALTADTISEVTSGSGVTIDSVVLKDGDITSVGHVTANAVTTQQFMFQGDPANSNTDPATKSTMANTMITSRILTATPGGAINYTLPTGTEMDTAVGSFMAPGEAFDFVFINLGAGGIVTWVAAADFTIVGTTTVPVNTSAMFRVRNTAANTYILYRIA